MTGHIKQLGDGQLCNSVGVHARCIVNLYAVCLGSLKINMVQTDGAYADNLQVLRSVQNPLVDLRVHAHDENIIVRDHGSKLILGRKDLGIDLHVLSEYFADASVYFINNETLHDNFPPFGKR